MKKYSTPAYVDNESGVTEFGSVDVYLASEVDARIAELEALISAMRPGVIDMAKATEPYEDRIAELEKALREIAALDYKNAATNGAAYEAVQIASWALMESQP